MSSSSVYAKGDWRKVLGIGWLWLLRPDHAFLCNTDDPNNVQTEAFTLEIACQLIGETELEEGIQVIQKDEE